MPRPERCPAACELGFPSQSPGMNRIILRQNAGQLKTVLVYLFHDAGIGSPFQRTVVTVDFISPGLDRSRMRLGDAAHGLYAAAEAQSGDMVSTVEACRG